MEWCCWAHAPRKTLDGAAFLWMQDGVVARSVPSGPSAYEPFAIRPRGVVMRPALPGATLATARETNDCFWCARDRPVSPGGDPRDHREAAESFVVCLQRIEPCRLCGRRGLRQGYSASISPKCRSTMNWLRTVQPSSPASSRHITSRRAAREGAQQIPRISIRNVVLVVHRAAP